MPKWKPKRYKAYQRQHLDRLPELAAVPGEVRNLMKAVASVLPFRTNNYVVEELIRWEDVPGDPLYQLTFPQPGMLSKRDVQRMAGLVRREAPAAEVRAAAGEIQARLNPHPAGQATLNVPRMDGEPVPGMQHKYRETVLFFPRQGQTCHAYCTYCFRWPQFVGLESLKFAAAEVEPLVAYVRAHPEVTSILFTGGDPLIMSARVLESYVRPMLDAGIGHLVSLRIGTKAPAYWPYRFLSDPDADDLLRIFESVVAAGKHLAIMAHVSHPREMETPAAQAALRRIRDTGAVIRCQAPLIRHVNDDAVVWAEMWRRQVALGAVPYYMFVERDTGPRNYFEVPLVRAHEIFRRAYRSISGLARTVRGPSMSATPGKVVIEGTARIGGDDVFVLKFIQSRDPRWVGRPFFAQLDPRATWFDQLRPALGERRFFFDPPLGLDPEGRGGRGRGLSWGTGDAAA